MVSATVVVVSSVVVVSATVVVVSATVVVVSSVVVVSPVVVASVSSGAAVVVVGTFGTFGTPSVDKPLSSRAAMCAARVPLPYHPSASIPRTVCSA